MPTADSILKVARLVEQTGGWNPRRPPRRIDSSVPRHTHFVEDTESGEYKFVVDPAPGSPSKPPCKRLPGFVEDKDKGEPKFIVR